MLCSVVHDEPGRRSLEPASDAQHGRATGQDDLPSAGGGRWDLSSLYPPIGSAAYDERLKSIRLCVGAFAARAAELPRLGPARLSAWVEALLELEGLEAVQTDFLGYLDCLCAENPAAEAPRARLAEARGVFKALTTAAASMLAALGLANEREFAALCASPALAGAEEQLRTLRRQGVHALNPAEERFVADAAMDGLRRWANLAAETIATTAFEVALPSGELSLHSMSERYELMWDARPEVRLAAYEGVEAAFAPKAALLGECFNAMAGFEQSRARRRGRDLVSQILEDDHRIGRATIDTMQSALRKNAPVLHAYLELKARLLGLPRLGMQDRSAPMPAPASLRSGQAMDLILGCFEPHCPPLAEHARQVLAQRWIDSELRPDKRTGGFCALFPVARETRVFVSLGESLNSIAGLAHELGHAFHDECNFDQRWWAQQAPAALCETAAILCEHFLRDGIARDPDATRSARAGSLDLATGRGGQLHAAHSARFRV